MTAPNNLFDIASTALDGEAFDELLHRRGTRVERIVSRGHTTPADEPYLQAWDEWVLVLAGEASLTLGNGDQHMLTAGEYLFIPANVPHWVTHTANPTIWLAIHFDQA